MIELSEIKEYLNIDGTGKDTFLQVALETAVSEVESYCNRKLTSGTYTQYSDGNGKDELFIQNYPAISVGSVEVFDGYDTWSSLFTGGDTTANSLFIIPELNKIKIIKGYIFPTGFRNIKISYTSGYTSETCPSDIRGVLLEMLTIFYYNSPQSGQARLGKSSENMSSTASTSAVFKDLKPEWKDRLRKYKKFAGYG